MAKKINISFVIPAKNEANYIKNCLDSILPQLEKGDEIIVVDNNSTDNTAEIAKKLGAKVVLEKKPGISFARNRGVSAAKHEIVAFIDADGVINKKWLEIAKRSLQNSDKYAVSGLNIFTIKNKFWFIVFNIYTVFAYGYVLVYRYLLGKTFIVGNNVVIRKDIFTKLGGFDDYVGEDFYFSQKFWKKYRDRADINFQMKIYYSSRRFEKKGFLNTVFYWFRSGTKKISQKGYALTKQ